MSPPSRPSGASHAHAGPPTRAPRDLRSRRLAVDHRKRRLEGVDMAKLLASVKKGDVEVRDTGPPHLSLFHELPHLFPGLLHRHARAIRPMELVEVDPLDAEPAERRLALPMDRPGTQGPPDLPHRVLLVTAETALREDVRR